MEFFKSHLNCICVLRKLCYGVCSACRQSFRLNSAREKMRSIFFALAVGLFGAGIAAAEPQSCDAACKVQMLLDKNVGIAVDRAVTLDELRRFAPVVRETTSKIDAVTPGNSAHRFEYAGLVVAVEVTAENNVIVQAIDLTGGKFQLPYGLKVGKIDRAHDPGVVLGPPAEKQAVAKGEMWIYRNLEQTMAVAFERSGAAIVAVHWDFAAAD